MVDGTVGTISDNINPIVFVDMSASGDTYTL
jgi:hypothetical protein